MNRSNFEGIRFKKVCCFNRHLGWCPSGLVFIWEIRFLYVLVVSEVSIIASMKRSPDTFTYFYLKQDVLTGCRLSFKAHRHNMDIVRLSNVIMSCRVSSEVSPQRNYQDYVYRDMTCVAGCYSGHSEKNAIGLDQHIPTSGLQRSFRRAATFRYLTELFLERLPIFYWLKRFSWKLAEFLSIRWVTLLSSLNLILSYLISKFKFPIILNYMCW